MKICLIVWDMSQYGGVASSVIAQARLLSRDHQVSVLSIYGESSVYSMPESVSFESLSCKPARLIAARRRILPQIRKYMKEHHVDVAIAEGSWTGYVTIPLTRKGACRYLYYEHGALANQWDDKKLTLMRFLSSRAAHGVLVLTNRTLCDYRKYFRVPQKKLFLLPNALDEDIFAYAGAYNAESNCILSAGRFTKEKGYDLLLRVAELVYARHGDWTWEIFGDGELFETVRAEIEARGLSDFIVLRGRTSNMPEKYQNHAFFVLPSYREGLPMVLLEAQANHLPLVSFDVVTGPSDIISHGVNGYLVPPYDVEAMAECICTLIEDQSMRRSFSMHAADHLAQFSQEAVRSKFEAVFADLLKGACALYEK